MLVLSGSALAAGGRPTAQPKSGAAAAPNTHASGTSTDPGGNDVPGASVDPGAKTGHDTSRGIGNDCDPGFGGSVTEHANDSRFSASSEDETSGCGGTTGVGGSGAVAGAGTAATGSSGGVGGAGSAPATTTGFGGAAEAATTAVLAATGGGSGGGGLLATIARLANTGLKAIILGALAVILIVIGTVLFQRRRRVGA